MAFSSGLVWRQVHQRQIGWHLDLVGHVPAAHRFAHQAAPALQQFADSSPAAFVSGVRAAREQVVARKDEDRETFLRRRGFSKPETEKIIGTVLREEGRPPESVFDFVQGITALARSKTHQDARLELESRAAKLMDAVV